MQRQPLAQQLSDALCRQTKFLNSDGVGDPGMVVGPALNQVCMCCRGALLSTLAFVPMAADVDDAAHALGTEANASGDARRRFTIQPRLEDLGIAFNTAPMLRVSLLRCNAAHEPRGYGSKAVPSCCWP